MTYRDIIELIIAAILAVLAYAHREAFEYNREMQDKVLKSLEETRIEMVHLNGEISRLIDTISRRQ